MVDLNRRSLMATSVATALGASTVGSDVASASESEIDESDTEGAPSVKGDLKRFANTAFGAEVTGPYVFEDGTLLFSNQHPSDRNQGRFKNPGVGYFSGFQFEMEGTNDDFEELGIPDTEDKQTRIRSSGGTYTYLGQGRDSINAGEERLGVTQTPDGTDVTMDTFEGTQYGAAATNPDCNRVVEAGDESAYDGFLYTNWENSPGNVSRIPLTQTEDGEWEADLDNAMNLANTESLRSLGGTRINCYGDTTPWGTMVTSEENYAHPRVSLTNDVSDIVESGGEGLVGAAHFWNRPNPASIPGVVGDYAEQGRVDSSWYPQGSFALAGVEFLAYYLGADQVDQGDSENTLEPISDVYPNPYRYGYHVEFREQGDDEPPMAVKHYVIGRASWECPDFQNDNKTVYGCSDGDSKGIYKFVADRPMTSYDDPMEISGTLYAPKITNDTANVEEVGTRYSPAEVNLDVEWIPLGRASNAEVEGWISEYDDVTQVDYLEAHAETDWEDDIETALREADLEVIENGNQNYVSGEEVVEWAEEWESLEEPKERNLDEISEDLRKVPFLETRAAAKEIGASIEFNKAEGVDSATDARPGNYVYFGISEFNDDLADETGDVQMDRVDGGVVYRGELEGGYNISTLEPVVVGPDFTDSPEVANDALRNIDNVYVMDDGRVLCCEDGFDASRRSYPNDCMYVLEPEGNANPGKGNQKPEGNANADGN